MGTKMEFSFLFLFLFIRFCSLSQFFSFRSLSFDCSGAWFATHFSLTLSVQEAKWWNKYYQRVLYTYGLACARLSSQEKHYTEQDLLLLLLCCCFDRVLRELRSLFLSHFSIFTVMLCVRYWTFSLCYMQKKKEITLSLFVHFLRFFLPFVIKINTIKMRFYFSKTFFFLDAFSPVRSVLFIYFFFQTIPFLDCKIYPFVHNSCVNLGFVFCLFDTACGGRRSIDTDIHRGWFFFFSLSSTLPCG